MCRKNQCEPLCQIENIVSAPPAADTAYHIIAGSVDGHCFIYANGDLLIEMVDNKPETLKDCGRFGFGTYASRIRYRNLKAYKAIASPLFLEY